MPIIQLKPHEERRIRTGHLWVFSNEIDVADESIPDGGLAELLDARGSHLGQVYLNRHSLIAARILTRSRNPVDDDFLARRIRNAMALRRRVLPDPRFGRIVFGESDGLPGLVVDRYDTVLVVQIGTLGMEQLWPHVERALRRELAPKAIYLRSDMPSRSQEGLGPDCRFLDPRENGRVEVQENGLTFHTDVVTGQKTGWFYDQRENRALLRGRMEGARVLDAFCYAGAWSVSALAWGAASALALDSSAPALELAAENATLNGVADRVEFRKVDVFTELRRMDQANERFEVVVLDPPALIKSRARIEDGVRGYHDLNRLAMRMVKPGGVLFTCSCSHLMPREDFLPMLARAARDARVSFRVGDFRGQAPDHPVLLAMRETDYLKCAVLERLE